MASDTEDHRADACRRARPQSAGRRGQGSNAARKRGSDVSAVREQYEAAARIMPTSVAASPFPCALRGFQVVPSKANKRAAGANMCNGVARAGMLAVTLQLLLGLPEHAAGAEVPWAPFGPKDAGSCA